MTGSPSVAKKFVADIAVKNTNFVAITIEPKSRKQLGPKVGKRGQDVIGVYMFLIQC